MFNDKNKTNNSNSNTPIDPAKKDGTKVTEPLKEGVKVDPKKDETIKS